VTKDRGLSQRETILDATLAIIAEKQISGTRMREVAMRSGISQGHLHYYFSTKNDLFLAAIEHLSSLFVEGRRQALDDPTLPPDKKLDIFLDQEVELIKHSLDLLKVRLDFVLHSSTFPLIASSISTMFDNWDKDITNVITEGIQAGIFAEDHGVEIPHILMALMDGIVLRNILGSKDVDTDEHFNRVREIIHNLLQPM